MRVRVPYRPAVEDWGTKVTMSLTSGSGTGRSEPRATALTSSVRLAVCTVGTGKSLVPLMFTVSVPTVMPPC